MRHTRILGSLSLLATALLAGTVVVAQHESAGAIEEGRSAFQSVCANCHGPDGDHIRGIDLWRGQFRRQFTDADLSDIIRKGIPGTPMPASNVSEQQAARIVAYLRSTAASMRPGIVPGSPTSGRALFDGKGACTTCHAINGKGSHVGPDLSTIGALRRAAELEASILDPAAEVLPQNRFIRVTTRDGRAVTGRLLNQDTFSVQLMDSNQRLRAFDKSTLREQAFIETPMPSCRDRLAAQELADLVSYLTTLRFAR